MTRLRRYPYHERDVLPCHRQAPTHFPSFGCG